MLMIDNCGLRSVQARHACVLRIVQYNIGSYSHCFSIRLATNQQTNHTDGQMGVAGDGNKGLEKEWKGQASMGKSKMMSAKNAWGSSSGYAAKLIDEGMEATRAQQFENWGNQQEVLASRKAHRYMTDDFDSETSTADEDWRKLSKFGVERNEVRAIFCLVYL
jgi:hypothetical protein